MEKASASMDQVDGLARGHTGSPRVHAKVTRRCGVMVNNCVTIHYHPALHTRVHTRMHMRGIRMHIRAYAYAYVSMG